MSERNGSGVSSSFQQAMGEVERVAEETPLSGELRSQTAEGPARETCAPELREYACDEQAHQILAMDLSVEGVLTMMGASEEDLAAFNARKAELSSEELAAICRRQGVPERVTTQE